MRPTRPRPYRPTMDRTESFLIPLDVAESYEARFVPAIFAEWAPRLLDAVEISPGDRVLDVACGTGVVARDAAARVGAERVVGVDLNPAMLKVARRIAPDIDWREGDAVALPVDDASFDVATCQMALMFMPDRRAVWADMRRAVRPGGRVGVVVPAALDVQPAYRVFVDVAVAFAGDDARSLLATYWNCGDLDGLVQDIARCGLTDIRSCTIPGTARFESAADFVATEIGSSPLGERIDADTAAQISTAVAERLGRYDGPGGFGVPLHCHVVIARRP